jgi:hypothetical protein
MMSSVVSNSVIGLDAALAAPLGQEDRSLSARCLLIGIALANSQSEMALLNRRNVNNRRLSSSEQWPRDKLKTARFESFDNCKPAPIRYVIRTSSVLCRQEPCSSLQR